MNDDLILETLRWRVILFAERLAASIIGTIIGGLVLYHLIRR